VEDKELEKILKKKLKMYMESLKQREEDEKEGEKEDIFKKAQPLFTEDGYKHLINIKKRDEELAEKILGYIVQLIYSGLLKSKADYVMVERLRRRISGETGKIYVYKKGELKDLSSSLREEN